MSTVSLYRVKRAKSAKRYWVDEVYRIHTNQELKVPADFQLNGVATDIRYRKWLINEVYALMEHHMGDAVVDSWAVCSAENDAVGHVTIALCVNDVLIDADILSNTTSFRTSPTEHKNIANLIMDAIKEREPCRKFAPLVFSPKWEMDAYCDYITNLY